VQHPLPLALLLMLSLQLELKKTLCEALGYPQLPQMQVLQARGAHHCVAVASKTH
jgi:hypothetical protein